MTETGEKALQREKKCVIKHKGLDERDRKGAHDTEELARQ